MYACANTGNMLFSKNTSKPYLLDYTHLKGVSRYCMGEMSSVMSSSNTRHPCMSTSVDSVTRHLLMAKDILANCSCFVATSSCPLPPREEQSNAVSSPGSILC